MYCSCGKFDQRLAFPGEDESIRECPVCQTRWRLTRVVDGPPPGWRGQWSGWIEVRVPRPSLISRLAARLSRRS